MNEQNVDNNMEKVGGQSVIDNLNQQMTLSNIAAPLAQSAVISQTVPSVKYAGFWIRLLAAIIDGIVISVISIPIAAAFYFLSGNFFIEEVGMGSSMGFNFLGYAISWGYYILMTDKYQATLGKKAMGIVVVAEDFSKIPLGKIILRETVGKVVSGIIFGIGYIMAAFTSRKRALHDIISGTVVIYKEPGAKIHKGVIIGVVVACILFFVSIMGILVSIVLISLNSARDEAKNKINNQSAYPIVENVKEI